MPASTSVIVAKDGAGTTITGGLIAQDKSGAGTGPFVAAHVIIDAQGVNVGTVKAASTAVAAGDTAVAVGLHPTSPLPAGTNVIGHVIVDTAPTTAITAAALPLPALASTSTKQSDGSQKTQVVDGGGNVMPSGDVVARAMFEKITDGTNTAAVKAASTAAVATDPALVVALSPNNVLGALTATGNALDINVKSGVNANVGNNADAIAAAATTAAPVVNYNYGYNGTTWDRLQVDGSKNLKVVGAAGEAHLGAIGGNTVTQAASSTITRPADTTAYTSGDLVANSVTAGSVVNLQFTTLARVSGGSGVIIGAQIQKSGSIVTSAAFRLHLFNTAPTYTSAGDNTALSTVVVASAKGYLGYIDITAMVGFSDVAWGSGAPDNSRGGIPYVATAQIIYGLLEARGAYTPISGEVFTISVDALQD